MHFTWSDALWLLPALAVFWAVGAYNRLVRLRAQALRAYALLDAELLREAALLQSALPDAEAAGAATVAGEMMDDLALAWRGLRAALAQFGAVLSATRARALDPEAVAALATARSVVDTAWRRALQEGQDLAGAPVPEGLQARWEELARAETVAAAGFNDAVAHYNGAVRQFPALLLAWLFGMRPSRGL